MSDHETEPGGMGPLGMKRTSKHPKKLARRGAHQRRVVPSPPAKPRDARVGGVNAEYSAHGRSDAKDEERRGRGGRTMTKGEDEGTGLEKMLKV